MPATPLQPLNPLQRDVVRDVSVFFDGTVFNDVPRLSIPLHPIVYVSPQVAALPAERERSDPLFYSNPGAVHHNGIQSTSIGSGLGMDPTVFVQVQVRKSQDFGELIDDIAQGRLSRLSLGSDGRIATPEWFQPDADQIVPSMPGDEQVPTQQQPPQKQAAERADALDAVTAEGAKATSVSLVQAQPVLRPAAAPSFSEQLRSAGTRAPVAARPATAVPFVS